MKENLSRALKEYRKKQNLSQEKLAQKIGISYLTVSRWERKLSLPSPLALEKLRSMEII